MDLQVLFDLCFEQKSAWLQHKIVYMYNAKESTVFKPTVRHKLSYSANNITVICHINRTIDQGEVVKGKRRKIHGEFAYAGCYATTRICMSGTVYNVCSIAGNRNRKLRRGKNVVDICITCRSLWQRRIAGTWHTNMFVIYRTNICNKITAVLCKLREREQWCNRYNRLFSDYFIWRRFPIIMLILSVLKL